MNLRRLIENFDTFTLADDHPRVLLFGDSVLRAVETSGSKEHTFARSVEIVFPPEWRTSILGFYAANVVLFHKLWSCIEKRPYAPDVVIIPFNLRTFSPLWFLNPRHTYSSLFKSLDTLEGGLGNDELTPVDLNEEIALDKNASLRVVHPTTWSFYGLGETELREFFDVLYQIKPLERAERRRVQMTGYYLFQLSEEHVLWTTWRDLIQRILDRGSSVLVYICGFNWAKVKTVLGEDLDESIRAKRILAQGFFKGFSNHKRFHHADFASSLGEDCFFDYVEHLSLKGRRIMAVLLSRMTNTILTGKARPRG